MCIRRLIVAAGMAVMGVSPALRAGGGERLEDAARQRLPEAPRGSRPVDATQDARRLLASPEEQGLRPFVEGDTGPAPGPKRPPLLARSHARGGPGFD